MYVLYYNNGDIDSGSFCFKVIGISESKNVLEEEIERLMKPVLECQEKFQIACKNSEDYRIRSQKKIRKWLTENSECIREIRPQISNKEFYVKDFHTLNNTPYHPDVKKREIEKAIDLIVTTHWFMFVEDSGDIAKRQDQFINKDVLTNPVIVIKSENYPCPEISDGFIFYEKNGFVIEDVKVFPSNENE